MCSMKEPSSSRASEARARANSWLGQLVGVAEWGQRHGAVLADRVQPLQGFNPLGAEGLLGGGGGAFPQRVGG